jgi:glutaredoxin 2
MASQAKDRHSAQLARSLTEFNQTITQTKSLLEQFSTDLDAMRTLTAIHVSQ